MQKKQRRLWAKKCSFTFPNKREKLIPWILLAPSLTGVSVFILIPFADVVRRSFLQAVGGRFVGLENYKMFWKIPLFGWQREIRSDFWPCASLCFWDFLCFLEFCFCRQVREAVF